MGHRQEVLLLFTLMDEGEKLPIAGRALRLALLGAQDNRRAAIVVEFICQNAAVGVKITTYLGSALAAMRPTHKLQRPQRFRRDWRRGCPDPSPVLLPRDKLWLDRMVLLQSKPGDKKAGPEGPVVIDF